MAATCGLCGGRGGGYTSYNGEEWVWQNCVPCKATGMENSAAITEEEAEEAAIRALRERLRVLQESE